MKGTNSSVAPLVFKVFLLPSLKPEGLGPSGHPPLPKHPNGQSLAPGTRLFHANFLSEHFSAIRVRKLHT